MSVAAEAKPREARSARRRAIDARRHANPTQDEIGQGAEE